MFSLTKGAFLMATAAIAIHTPIPTDAFTIVPSSSTTSSTSTRPINSYDTILHSEKSSSSSSSSASSASYINRILRQTKKSKPLKVKRIIDASTIQLENVGHISLQTVRGAGGTYQLPECMDRSPSSKLRQLLPKGTVVRIVDLDDLVSNGAEKKTSSSPSQSSSTPKMWIVREDDEVLINRELVKSGFAFVRKGTRTPTPTPTTTATTTSSSSTQLMKDMMSDLMQLETNAKQNGLGIYKSCDSTTVSTTSTTATTLDNDGQSSQSSSSSSQENFVAEFEPMDYQVETHYSDDGGTSVIVSKRDSPTTKPSNPGDIVGCSDFDTYEASLAYYEKYSPYYGDVARLDRDGDGVPCPGLTHTSVGERYRMKVPDGVKSSQQQQQ
mmetsp:Transcript_16497/g.29824  ORF Transcript_16497/g.29824 Transcript_16497/m.29824 type:complete len:383 (+) Transcript_16497:30-1178(+)